jgi:hypothetical protein
MLFMSLIGTRSFAWVPSCMERASSSACWNAAGHCFEIGTSIGLVYVQVSTRTHERMKRRHRNQAATTWLRLCAVHGDADGDWTKPIACNYHSRRAPLAPAPLLAPSHVSHTPTSLNIEKLELSLPCQNGRTSSHTGCADKARFATSLKSCGEAIVTNNLNRHQTISQCRSR